MRKALLLLILLLPLASGLSTDKTEYLSGEPIVLSGAEGVLTVTTPTGTYQLLGSQRDVRFPTSGPGEYTFDTAEQSVTVHVLQSRTILLRTAKGASILHAAENHGKLWVALPGVDALTVSGLAGELRVTPSMGERWGFKRTYAVDPVNFEEANLTFTAQGSSLYKCGTYQYFTETCPGGWEFQMALTPGEQYTLTVSGADPAFGEGDANSVPVSCVYSDEPGAGNDEQNVNCLTEVQTKNNGTTANLDDNEASGGSRGNPSVMEVAWENELSVASVNNASVTVRYYRVPNVEIADTEADFQIWTDSAWTTVCTDTAVSIGSWEDYTCDMSAYITNEAQANDVQVRLHFYTRRGGPVNSYGRVYVDFAYYALDYVYDDRYPPTYSSITASPLSPKTYDGQPSSFSVNWEDDVAVDAVVIEQNFTGTWQNATVTGGPTYTHNQVLGAGSYSWRQIANDTSGNVNDTMPLQSYIVNQAAGSVMLELNGTRGNLTIDEGTTINLTGTRLAGEIAMQLHEDSVQLTSGASIQLERTYNDPGTYTLMLNMSETQNYTSATESWTLTVLDITPPGPVTDLQNTSAGESWVYWTWNNPPDSDYSHAIIDINETFYANVSTSYVNVTGLNAGTLYEISVRTVDASNNINEDAQTDLGSTLTSTDTEPPIISDIEHHNVTDSEATIIWDTDEPANSRVKYGNQSGNYTHTQSNSQHVMSHSIQLTGLKPSTTYYYVVNSTDPAGNTNQSSEYSFTTGVDVTPPKYGTINAVPSSGQTYPVTTTFSVAWTDNGEVSVVLIEHNFTGIWRNDTMTGGPTHEWTQALGAGTFSWRSIANDTEGNTNDTMPLQTYTVNKASAQVELFLDGLTQALEVDEGSTVNITVQRITGEGEVKVLENGTQLALANPPLTYQKQYNTPGLYNITGRIEATQNYTAHQTSLSLTVNDITPPAVSLIEPFDERTSTSSEVEFTFSAQDNVKTQNCTLIIDNTTIATEHDITDGAVESFTHTLSDGTYEWTVSCTDTSNNTAQATPARILHVLNIYPWIPTVAVHSGGATVTAQVNQSDSNTVTVARNAHITVSDWSNTAPNNADISEVVASCEVTFAERGATTFFQYNTGSGWSGDICGGPQNGIGTFSCDLFAQGVDTVSELNNLQVRCINRDTAGGPASNMEVDYIEVQPAWTLIELPDFAVTEDNLTMPVTATEGQSVSLQANVSNLGVVGASAKVEFYDLTRQKSIQNVTQHIPTGEWRSFNATWTAEIGVTVIEVRADPGNVVEELSLENNNASKNVTVGAWHTYYGNTVERFLALSDQQYVQYNWSNENLQGNIYAMDSDASVSMLNLRALTRTLGGSLSFDDLAQADEHLGLTGLPDSINSTYSDGGALRATSTFTVSGVEIHDVPVVNSTVSENFLTGVLWDADSDTNGYYDGEEALVFVTQTNLGQAGAFGTYDYELTVPALLRQDRSGGGTISLFIEVT